MSGESNISDLLSAITGLVTSTAALGGLVVAAVGLSTWRRELRGREEFALARDILRALYRVRDEISLVRDPNMFPSEWAKRPGGDESQPISDPKDVEYAYQQRWDRLIEASSDLEAKLLEAEVLWGSVLAPSKTSLKRLIVRLNVKLRQHLRSLTNERYAEGLTPDKIREIDAVIWENYDEPDAFSSELRDVIEQFESSLRPHLGRKRAGWSLRERFCRRSSAAQQGDEPDRP